MPVRQHPEVWRNVTGGRQDTMGKYLTIHRRQDSLQTHVPDSREPCSQRSGTAVPAVGNHVPSGRELRYLAPLQAADPHRIGKLPAVFQTSLPVESSVRSPERQKSPKGFSAPAGNDRNPRAQPPPSCQPLIEALEKQAVPSGQVRPASDFHNSLSPSGQPIASVRIPATAGIYHRHGRLSGIGKPAEEQMRFRHCHTPSKEAGPPYAKHVYGTAIPPRLPAQSLAARRTTKEAPPLSVCRVWRRRGTGLVVSCHPLSIWRQQDRGQTQRL